MLLLYIYKYKHSTNQIGPAADHTGYHFLKIETRYLNCPKHEQGYLQNKWKKPRAFLE